MEMVVRGIMAEEEFAAYFADFSWPWYMPAPEEYEALLAGQSFAGIEVRLVHVDYRFPDAERFAGWIEQPSLVPFLGHLPAGKARCMRDSVVERMLAACARPDGTYGETFERLDVKASRPAF